MANLTDTAYYSRLGVKYGAIGIAVLMVGRIVVSAGINYWKALHPPPPPPPTVGFGILPDIEFPAKTTPNPTYTLETATGKLPQFPDRADVFFIPAQRPNLLALERSIAQADDLGFKSEPVKVSNTSYRWNSLDPLPSTLEIEIYTGLFKMKTDWNIDPAFLLEKKLPAEPQAVEDAKRYLQQAKLLPEDLKDGEAAITYLKATGGELLKTVSLSEADFLQVDMFRAKVNKQYAVVTADPEKAPVRVIFSGNQSVKVVGVEYDYFPVDYTLVHTYPLKPANEAWQELAQGKGYIAEMGKNETNVTIRRVELGYFDSFAPQKYLQPVYIFSGDGGFIAYVPAVRPPSKSK